MINFVMLYLSAALTAIWGIAHLFPTGSVVRGFGVISADNQRIITMEWIVEGVSLIFIGTLVASVTFIDPTGGVSKAVFLLSAILLFVLALVSLFTGFKVNFLPFRLCPFIFTASALSIAARCIPVIAALMGTTKRSVEGVRILILLGHQNLICSRQFPFCGCAGGNYRRG